MVNWCGLKLTSQDFHAHILSLKWTNSFSWVTVELIHSIVFVWFRHCWILKLSHTFVFQLVMWIQHPSPLSTLLTCIIVKSLYWLLVWYPICLLFHQSLPDSPYVWPNQIFFLPQFVVCFQRCSKLSPILSPYICMQWHCIFQRLTQHLHASYRVWL